MVASLALVGSDVTRAFGLFHISRVNLHLHLLLCGFSL